jgi:hypothetical protein
MLVTVFPWESIPQRRRRRSGGEREHETEDKVLWRHRRIVPEPNCPGDPVCSIIQVCGEGRRVGGEGRRVGGECVSGLYR